MKSNMGSLDKTIRIILAVVFSMLFITKTVEGPASIVLLVLGGVFLLTSVISICPLYSILGLNTCKKNNTNK